MVIPEFRDDGYLPIGIHTASEADVVFRFGSPTPRRRRLVLRLRRWIELARAVTARRLLVDGSFVTAKDNPGDIDAVVLLPANFEALVDDEDEAALELDINLTDRQPEELFAAEDEADWDDWVEFFSQTREVDRRRKGLIEVVL